MFALLVGCSPFFFHHIRSEIELVCVHPSKSDGHPAARHLDRGAKLIIVIPAKAGTR
jgi:hypothetical protein